MPINKQQIFDQWFESNILPDLDAKKMAFIIVSAALVKELELNPSNPELDFTKMAHVALENHGYFPDSVHIDESGYVSFAYYKKPQSVVAD